MKHDTVSLMGMRFFARVGVLPHEAELPQPVEVDVSATVYASVRPPQVVDYVAMYAAVERIISVRHIAYLEEAGEQIAHAVLSLEGVRAVSVSVRKPHVPLPGPVGYAEVTIFRGREE